MPEVSNKTRHDQESGMLRLTHVAIAGGALKHFFERNKIDPDVLRRCLRQYCVEDDPRRRRRPAFEGISPTTIANLVNDRRFVDAIRNFIR